MEDASVKLVEHTPISWSPKTRAVFDAEFPSREVPEEGNIRGPPVVVNVWGTTQIAIHRDLINFRAQNVADGAQQSPTTGIVRVDRVGRKAFHRVESVTGNGWMRNVRPCVGQEGGRFSSQPLDTSHSGLRVAARP